MHVLVAWLAATGIVAFALTVSDKRRARTGRRRVRERTLLAWAVLGGWLGMALAMLVARHKTRKPAFLLPFLACAVANGVLVWAVDRWVGWP